MWIDKLPNYPNFPSIKDYVDVERNSKYDLKRLKQYLKKGYIRAVAGTRSVPSLFTGEPIYGELITYSDGKWFYDSTLIYYIENNQLAIPDEWYEEIVRNNFIVPKISDEQLKILQSPMKIDLNTLF